MCSGLLGPKALPLQWLAVPVRYNGRQVHLKWNWPLQVHCFRTMRLFDVSILDATSNLLVASQTAHIVGMSYRLTAVNIVSVDDSLHLDALFERPVTCSDLGRPVSLVDNTGYQHNHYIIKRQSMFQDGGRNAHQIHAQRCR